MKFLILSTLLLKILEMTIIVMVIKSWRKKRERNAKKNQPKSEE